MKLSMIMALAGIALLAAFGVWGLMMILQQDADVVTRRAALPAMERAGRMSANNTTLYLWRFEFEGKQCLWATASVGRGGRGGLTCWEPKP
jgi:hypothetical protein